MKLYAVRQDHVVFELFPREGLDFVSAPLKEGMPSNCIKCPEHQLIYSFTNANDEGHALQKFLKLLAIGEVRCAAQNDKGYCACPEPMEQQLKRVMARETKLHCAGIKQDGSGFYAYPIRDWNEGSDSEPTELSFSYREDKMGWTYLHVHGILDMAERVQLAMQQYPSNQGMARIFRSKPVGDPLVRGRS